ncbi:enterobactin transporter EntS [Gordonia insulae]|uniref:Enterobactin exporter EntS n=1 Tax=Gordonia insulae TaxID=2420509 RepID=A0A3G8JH94_9ACTN|nr:enterobactin transporter EntS [Gordonia insulae]AZG44373.1 Enterobactin exporter EntS [Gordonia insulae]
MSGARSLLIDISPLRESAPFRRIFVARLISLIGIGLLLVSVPVQMYDLTGSSAQVGAATAVTGITTFVGMLVGGSLADRFDRKRLILVGRGGAALSFAGLAVNAFGILPGTPSVAALYALAGIDGLIGALSTSALMAAVPTLIPRDKLVAVGALSALTVRVGSAVSPGIAGFIIAGAGVEWAYVVAACLATTTVLILLGLPSLPPSAPVVGEKLPSAPAGTEATPATTSLVRFILEQRVVAGVMIVGVLAMLGAGVVALLPALVAERFDGDARATGFLYAAVATGAMIAALTSGWLASVRRPGLLLVSALTAAFVVQIFFGLAPVVWLALGLLAVIGFIEAIQEVLRYSIIQHHTPGPLLGRVNGIWMAQEVGGITVGALVAGAFGTIWVASDAIVYYGVVMVVLSLIALVTLRSLVGVRKEPVHADAVN